jgi:hypothetical protein
MVESFDFGLLASSTPAQPGDVRHPVVQNWFFAREMMRRLGFAAQDLFLGVHPAQRHANGPKVTLIGLVLRTQGKEIEWHVGIVEEPPEVLAPRYDAEWIPAWNANQVDPGMDNYRCSWALTFGVPLMLKIQSLGLRIPGKN